MGCPRCDAAVQTRSKTYTIALVGNPNTGKSTLINALAGSDLSVGNWAGTTVERLEAELIHAGQTLTLVDLPGTYSLFSTTPEEQIARDALLQDPPDAIIAVLDAGNLERNLPLLLELLELGHPVVVALNMIDEAKAKGYDIDPRALETELGVPVRPTVASRGQGLEDLIDLAMSAKSPRPLTRYPPAIEAAIEALTATIQRPEERWIALALLAGEDLPTDPEHAHQAEERRAALLAEGVDPFIEITGARFGLARALFEKTLKGRRPVRSVTDRIDRLVLHPWLGPLFFLLGMLLVFRFTFSLSAPWVGFIGTAQAVLAGWIEALPLPALLASFLAEALVGGVGTVLAFTPVLFFLYLAMGFLEASGFMARAAFIADRLMHAAGLPGRAFIPMVLGFGCNVPAVYATRTLEAWTDRVRTALAIPFMSCSARLPVFVLFAAIFFPQNAALVVFGLYLLGLAVGLATAWLLGRLLKADPSTGVMELPPYRWPRADVLWRQAKSRTMRFVTGATGPILVAVMLIWALLHFPPGSLDRSLYATISRGLGTLFAPLGLSDWRVVGALIPGFVAKEVVVGALGLGFLGAQAPDAVGWLTGLATLAGALLEAIRQTLAALPALVGLSLQLPSPTVAPSPLSASLQSVLSPAAASAFLVYVLLYTPCVATLSALRQEFGRRWMLISVAYQLTLAYLLAFLAYRILA